MQRAQLRTLGDATRVSEPWVLWGFQRIDSFSWFRDKGRNRGRGCQEHADNQSRRATAAMQVRLFQGQQTPALTLAWRARDGMESRPGSIIYVPMEFKGFLSMDWSILSPNPEMAWPASNHETTWPSLLSLWGSGERCVLTFSGLSSNIPAEGPFPDFSIEHPLSSPCYFIHFMAFLQCRCTGSFVSPTTACSTQGRASSIYLTLCWGSSA